MSSNDKDTVKRLRDKINTTQKHKRIADGSPAGLKTAQEYQLNDVAEISDDEKLIRSAENRALKQTKQGEKSRFSPYIKPAPAAAAGSPAQLPSYGLQQQNNILQTANPSLIPFVQPAGAHRKQVTSATNVSKQYTGNQHAPLSSAALRPPPQMKLIITIYTVLTGLIIVMIMKSYRKSIFNFLMKRILVDQKPIKGKRKACQRIKISGNG